jgi:C-terminal processing protease CtpA/Prc
VKNKKLLLFIALVLLTLIACDISSLSLLMDGSQDTNDEVIYIDENNENEPVFITGTIPYTSPFFLSYATEPFVLLEDQAGFYARDYDFEFDLDAQVIGPVWEIEDGLLGFSISLPAVPQATLLDLDNDNEEDQGVMVFAIALWSNVWGGPFMEPREGTGWSNAHTTTITDDDDEFTGGHLIIWAPDDSQEFPSGFGDDGLLFTEDDPVTSVPSGYSIVDMNQDEFQIYKEALPEFELIEGAGALNDFSDMDYDEAFNNMFEKISLEYAFTDEKNIDWDALYEKYMPLIEDARNDNEFSNIIRAFTYEFPDAHVGLSFNQDSFIEEVGGSFGMMLKELSDGTVIVTKIYPGYQASKNEIEVEAEIITWNGIPVSDAIGNVIPFMGPYSTDHHRRTEQVNFLTRYPIGREVQVVFQNPGGSQQTVEMAAEFEVVSFLDTLPYMVADQISLPIEGKTLSNNITYIKISTFQGDQSLMTRIWEHYIDNMIEEDSQGLIIDMRSNYGGSGGIAASFAEYFIDEDIEVGNHGYYNDELGEFEFFEEPSYLEPAPVYYDKPIVVLVSHDCISACEGFAYYMSLNGHTTIIGHYPTAGAFGEVGLGQYSLPGDIDVQFPTGRPITPEGDILIEGVGIIPDIIVPITVESALDEIDAVRDAAIDLLQ